MCEFTQWLNHLAMHLWIWSVVKQCGAVSSKAVFKKLQPNDGQHSKSRSNLMEKSITCKLDVQRRNIRLWHIYYSPISTSLSGVRRWLVAWELEFRFQHPCKSCTKQWNTCNLSTEKAESGAYWPNSVAKSVSSWSVKDHVSKEKVEVEND